jgi:hypothetical protein
MDRDPMNCRPENLKTLCEPCHAKWHTRNDNFGDAHKHTYLDFDRIVSIDYSGEERVFDVAMTAPFHSFVANGFISHNSGPQAVINDTTRLSEGENIQSMYPWKIWQFTDPTHSGNKAMEFYQPSVNSEMLIRVFDRFVKLAEDRTGIPSYAWGSGQTGPGGGTATALSMLMNSANRLMKKSFKYMDIYLIRPTITRVYRWNMMYLEDIGIKGDCTVIASGVMALLVKEQRQLRLNEALNLTANPEDRQIIGMMGRAKLLRAAFKNMDAPDVIPDEKELEARMAKEASEAQALAAQTQAPPAAGMEPGIMAPAGVV